MTIALSLDVDNQCPRIQVQSVHNQSNLTEQSNEEDDVTTRYLKGPGSYFDLARSPSKFHFNSGAEQQRTSAMTMAKQ